MILLFAWLVSLTKRFERAVLTILTPHLSTGGWRSGSELLDGGKRGKGQAG